jgi:translocation and assembly module TamA
MRFYAGGDNSIRGYDLDVVATRDDEGNILGGRHLVVGSLEYEYRILENWSVAAFVDTGDAFDNATPEFRTGLGFGVRWQSPVGPVRIDLAHGLDEPGDTVRLHLNIGPDL